MAGFKTRWLPAVKQWCAVQHCLVVEILRLPRVSLTQTMIFSLHAGPPHPSPHYAAELGPGIYAMRLAEMQGYL